VETIVTLWNTSNYSVILCDTIPSGTTAPLVNGFRYVDIPDYRLEPGNYRISSYFSGGEYGWSTTSTSIPEISLIRGVYSLTHGYPSTNGSAFYYGPNFLIRPSCAIADRPVIDGSHLLCPGDSALLTIASGNLNSSSQWQWYSSSCGGTMRGNNDSLLVKPSVTTTYFLQGIGNCIDNGPCGEFTVEIHDTVLVTRDHQTLTANIAGAEYQWIDCDNGYTPVAGATGQSYTAEAEGEYAVMVTLGDCMLESECKHVTVVGVSSYLTEEDIRVYPNPAHDLIEIDMPEVPGPFTLEVINMQGQKIISRVYNATPHLQIGLTGLDPGMYIVRIKTSDRSVVTKIFKE
jgi:hypothetical protein